LLSGSPNPQTAAFGATLYSRIGSQYSFGAINWDPGSYTGLEPQAGYTDLGVEPNSPGSTAIEISLSGNTISEIIDSESLSDGGTAAPGPLAFVIAYQSPSPMQAFISSSIKSISMSADIAVPYSEYPGSGSTSSSNQIVMYMTFLDTTTGKQISFGETVFDGRGPGNAGLYIGADNGPGGTGDAVVTVPAGYTFPDGLYTSVPDAASYQSVSSTNFERFVFEVTPGNLLAAIQYANLEYSSNNKFSTNINNYTISNFSVDSEVEYYGNTNNRLAYSLQDFAVEDNTSLLSSSSSAAPLDLTALGHELIKL
jgi:hypothetical protein